MSAETLVTNKLRKVARNDWSEPGLKESLHLQKVVAALSLMFYLKNFPCNRFSEAFIG